MCFYVHLHLQSVSCFSLFLFCTFYPELLLLFRKVYGRNILVSQNLFIFLLMFSSFWLCWGLEFYAVSFALLILCILWLCYHHIFNLFCGFSRIFCVDSHAIWIFSDIYAFIFDCIIVLAITSEICMKYKYENRHSTFVLEYKGKFSIWPLNMTLAIDGGVHMHMHIYILYHIEKVTREFLIIRGFWILLYALNTCIEIII